MRWRIVIGSLISTAALFWGTGAVGAAPLPEPDTFLSGVLPELTNPGGSAPGSNDWSCRPSAEHPSPVVLVHGTGGNRQDNWAAYAPMLANEGFCVFSLTYGNFADLPWPLSAIGGMLPVDVSSGQLATFVDEVLAATGATKVDLVGHSQGTVLANNYAKFRGGAGKVGRIVSLAPPWDGTYGVDGFSLGAAVRGLGVDDEFQLGFPVCKACTELMHGSGLVDRLRSGGLYVPGIEYTNIVTRYDEIVVPYTSGIEPGPLATNIVVQDGCEQDYSDHLSIAGARRARTMVLNALDPTHQREVPCLFVPPVAG
ncbi:esterase/lipase family protein [Rhodococcus daqingensis]|uniref:Esterase/lipase family protein n=1 Tax=Rhodococcus daqingensis TaxID=2479363 RepID=A0ABW2S607_9NOCA